MGIKVTTVEIKDIKLPDSMQRAIACKLRLKEKRAKIISAEVIPAAGNWGKLLT
jgi:regulator of protease activity HflC (stomatin/prohibitin superfamily)